jgi:hypothetical protein
MSAEGVYRLLLRAYPSDFRSRYGREMSLLFRDEYRTRGATAFGFWITMVWDVARSASSMWVEEWSARVERFTRTLEAVMKLAGILAVLLGLLGVLNTLAETVAAMRGTLEGGHALSVALGGIAAVLLITAGAALLRSTPSSRQTATIALVASLVIILITRLTHPWMSGLSQLVGIGLPIVLLAVLHGPGRRGPSTSATA